MPCYNLRDAYIPEDGGKLIFTPRPDLRSIRIACNYCVGCRLERARQWAVRCMHEASCWENNCFITLTYSPENLPEDGSLKIKHFQDFMKRFRKKFSGMQPFVRKGKVSYPIRFYHCGEYGEVGGRPHYHALIFNFDFYDKVKVGTSNGHDIYSSPTLEKLWGKGHVVIGAVTFESAGYCARYIMKKQLGGFKDDSEVIAQYRAQVKASDSNYDDFLSKHYIDVHPITGELTFRAVEYSTMSRGSGIGKTWFEKYKEEVYPSDEVIVNGKRTRPPKYYDNLFKAEFPNVFEDILFERFERGKKYAWNSTPYRLSVREQCKKSQISSLVRNVI